MITVIIITGVVSAFLLSRYTYKPVFQLKEKARSLYGKNRTPSDNDYEFIDSSMEYLDRQNRSLQLKLNNFSGYSIFKLLKGEPVNSDEVTSLYTSFDSQMLKK